MCFTFHTFVLLLHNCSGDHTETVEIHFDPKKTSYKELLKMFWENHDSTACHSRQYMSAIFYHNGDQEQLAKESKEEHQKKVSRPIQTKIKPAETFYDAEELVVCVCATC